MPGKRLPPAQRFDRLVEQVTETGCWIWLGATTQGGYGWFAAGPGKRALAHRWAYEHFRDIIPAGLTLDHLCRVKTCANPWHLEPVTIKVNTLRSEGTIASRNLAKRVCPRGHQYHVITEAGRQRRRCRICNGVSSRNCESRKRDAVRIKALLKAG